MQEEDILDLELVEVNFHQITKDWKSKDPNYLLEDQEKLVAREYMIHQYILVNRVNNKGNGSSLNIMSSSKGRK